MFTFRSVTIWTTALFCLWSSLFFLQVLTTNEQGNVVLYLSFPPAQRSGSTLSPSGVMNIPPNYSFEISCYIQNQTYYWPRLVGPKLFKPRYWIAHQGQRPTSSFRINSMSSSYDGKYYCHNRYGVSRFIEIKTKASTEVPDGDQDEFSGMEISETTDSSDNENWQRNDKETSEKEEPDSKPTNKTACTCTYSLSDSNVVAYTDEDRIIPFGDRVKLGSKIRFRCSKIGYHRLHGASELTCIDCKWHSSMFPTCVLPRYGNVVLDIRTEDLTYSPSGVIIIPENLFFHIDCFILNGKMRAILQGPLQLPPISWRNSGQKVVSFQINAMNSSYNGKYVCKSERDNTILDSTAITIRVKESTCPIIPANKSLSITYSNEQEINSQARFNCLDQSSTLVGRKSIRCLPTFKWSGNLPICQYIECPEITDTDGYLSISYQPNRRVGSTVKFECSSGHVMHDAVSFKCLSNGSWSYPKPTCIAPSCSVDSLMNVLPNEVVPVDMDITGETMPYMSRIRLTCGSDNLKPIGVKNVTCKGIEGWIVGEVECIVACNPIDNVEELGVLVIPEKDLYRFGEQIIFSCQPGKTLSSSIERIMCLTDGWSESEFPSCITFK